MTKQEKSKVAEIRKRLKDAKERLANAPDPDEARNIGEAREFEGQRQRAAGEVQWYTRHLRDAEAGDEAAEALKAQLATVGKAVDSMRDELAEKQAKWDALTEGDKTRRGGQRQELTVLENTITRAMYGPGVGSQFRCDRGHGQAFLDRLPRDFPDADTVSARRLEAEIEKAEARKAKALRKAI